MRHAPTIALHKSVPPLPAGLGSPTGAEGGGELENRCATASYSLFTIGFTKTKAEDFFKKIKNSNVKKVIDVRLNNISQLAGFAKRDDLKYFLAEICDCDYEHQPLLSPTKDILDDYKKKKIDWNEYELRFNNLMKMRKPESLFNAESLNNSCLLCSEPTAHKCHRKLVAEYFKLIFQLVAVIHL